MTFLAAALLLLAQDPPLAVPDGWVAERVAGPPLVERPIMAAFDDRGRLFVADSAGVNLKGSDLLKNPPHRIRLLEDTNGDGTFDTSTVWADRLVFPQGLLWHQGAVYCTSPPSFWKLEDVDGDSVCDKRTELLTGLANTGVADDAHGACLGPDGRIYFLPGRMAHNLKLPDGTPLRKAVGPWLMRMRTDGSDVEFVSGAVGNPVEVDWLPEGDFFISGTFWAPDSFGGGLRDALIHGVEGGEYAVRDRVYNDRKRTGELLPVLVPMVATAPSGMTIARGGPFKGQLVCTYFNTHKVQRHALERDGATFRARTEEFVSSTSADFHPTDVLEDADGSYLVVDTGGWFRIGCPTSQIAKPQVLGGIWRVRRKDAPAKIDPPAIRHERTIRELMKAADPAGVDGVWALARLETPEARAAVRVRLAHADSAIRQAAAAVAGLHRDPEAVERLCDLVQFDKLLQVRREAATALGRIGDRRATAAIFESLRVGADRFLEHALVFALIRLADREVCVAALKDPSAVVRRAALVAIDQMHAGNPTPDLVTPLLDPVDAPLQQAALGVILSRGWSGEIFSLVRQWLADKGLDEARRELLRGILVAFARDPSMQDLASKSLRDESTAPVTRLSVLEAMARAPLDRLPATWLAEARWSLDSADERIVRQATAVVRSSATGEFDAALLSLARDEARPVEVRVDALVAVAPRLAKLEGPLYRFLAANVDKDCPPLLRLSAAEALGKAPLEDGQLQALAQVLAGAGPLEAPRLIGAFERSGNPSVGKRLVGALDGSAALKSLPADALKRAFAKQPEEVRQAAEPLIKSVSADTEAQKAKLEELAPAALAAGNAGAGREIFLGRKAGCTACHVVQGQGGRVGPDLSKIGSIRTGRDLLEAIVFPSATFARGYEPVLLRTKDGGVHDGILLRETPDAIHLFTSERLEKRIAKGSVDVLQQGKVSVMPQGLDAQLTREELRDLLSFLGSLR